MYGGERGGWVSIRGPVYCVNELHLFPWKMALWGTYHGPLGSTEEAGILWVPDFVTSSLSRFYSFEHFIKTPKPNHCFHLLGRASVWSGLFLSIAFKLFSFLGWEGREERYFSSGLPTPLWCSSKATAGSTARALRVGAATLQ